MKGKSLLFVWHSTIISTPYNLKKLLLLGKWKALDNVVSASHRLVAKVLTSYQSNFIKECIL